jgi:hypothetical protein
MSDLSPVELETSDVDVMLAEAFELVEEVLANLVEWVVAIVEADRVEGGTGADGLGGNETEGESLRGLDIVDADLVEGGTGADGLGGKETEGKSSRDLVVVEGALVLVACWRACLFGGPWS